MTEQFSSGSYFAAIVSGLAGPESSNSGIQIYSLLNYTMYIMFSQALGKFCCGLKCVTYNNARIAYLCADAACLAALDLGADVEQPFDCLIVQNRQAMQSMGRSMDWTLQDIMVDGLFCATLTGRRGGHTPFVQAGAETSDTGVEAFKPDPSSSGEGHSGSVGAGVGDENAESCGAVRPPRIPVVIRPPRRMYVVVVR